MKRRRVIVAGAVALALLSLTLTGCVRSATARGIGVLTSAPATSAPPTVVDGTDAFDTAMISLDQGYAVVVKYAGLTATGRMDPAHHAATVDFAGLCIAYHKLVALVRNRPLGNGNRALQPYVAEVGANRSRIKRVSGGQKREQSLAEALQWSRGERQLGHLLALLFQQPGVVDQGQHEQGFAGRGCNCSLR